MGIRIVTFEARSGFTHVAARPIAQSPTVTFVTRLRPCGLASRAARQIPNHRQPSGWIFLHWWFSPSWHEKSGHRALRPKWRFSGNAVCLLRLLDRCFCTRCDG